MHRKELAAYRQVAFLAMNQLGCVHRRAETVCRYLLPITAFGGSVGGGGVFLQQIRQNQPWQCVAVMECQMLCFYTVNPD